MCLYFLYHTCVLPKALLVRVLRSCNRDNASWEPWVTFNIRMIDFGVKFLVAALLTQRATLFRPLALFARTCNRVLQNDKSQEPFTIPSNLRDSRFKLCDSVIIADDLSAMLIEFLATPESTSWFLASRRSQVCGCASVKYTRCFYSAIPKCYIRK